MSIDVVASLFAVTPVEEGKLNAASPEFIPRSLQSGPQQQDVSSAAPSGDWEEGDSAVSGDNQSGEWQDGIFF